MKKILLFVIATMLFGNIQAQDEKVAEPKWKKGGDFSLTFNEVYFSNWAAGGQSSVSGNSFLNLYTHYNDGKIAWENTLGMAYGMMKAKDEFLKKTDDKLSFASKLGYKTTEKLFITALIDFKSQFTEGRDAENVAIISNILAPAYLVASVGLDYKENENFSIYFAPIALKSTFVLDDSLSTIGVFGVGAGENYRAELGGFLKTTFKKPIMKNIDFLTTLDLFSNYLDHPERVDVDWQVQLNMKVNKFISANIHTHLIYDYDIIINERHGIIQFKELFGAGLSYKF